MSETNIGGPWTVVDITDTPKAAPVETRSTRAEVLESIISIVHRRTGVDLTGEVTVEFDADTDEVTISLCGVTLSDGGDIIAGEREFEWTGTINIEISVCGTVTARSEDEARDEAEEALHGFDFRIDAYDGEVTDHRIENYQLWEVSEA
jgi:hypothetical protein